MINIRYNGVLVLEDVSLADTFWSRLCGYMFREIPHKSAIMFEPAPGIHTFFMKFPLDVIFLDKSNRIIKVYRNMKPWRHTFFHFNSLRVLEVPAGRFPLDIKEGDILEVQSV
jgi:uncharacterized membrane protein (UPF0127 family)